MCCNFVKIYFLIIQALLVINWLKLKNWKGTWQADIFLSFFKNSIQPHFIEHKGLSIKIKKLPHCEEAF